jgi:hypothetical protein
LVWFSFLSPVMYLYFLQSKKKSERYQSAQLSRFKRVINLTNSNK